MHAFPFTNLPFHTRIIIFICPYVFLYRTDMFMMSLFLSTIRHFFDNNVSADVETGALSVNLCHAE